MGHICSHKFVWTFDNYFRPLIHNPGKIFGPYVKTGMRVLDAGCGAGFAAIGMARLVGDAGNVVAADVQPEMLAKVARRSQKAGLGHRIQTHLSHVGDLGVAGRFDFVNAFYMVHEVPDTAAFFRQVYDRLQPDGHFLVVEPKFHVSREKFEQMLQLADKTGFKSIKRPQLLASYAVVMRKNPDDR